MRKIILIGMLLAIGLITLVSCSSKEDSRRGPEENLKSVNGTEWIASKATIKFNNGKYTIDCRVPGSGTYTQNGNRITFDGNIVILSGGGVRPTEGIISKYGDSMTVTFKSTSTWGGTESLKFTYNILAD